MALRILFRFLAVLTISLSTGLALATCQTAKVFDHEHTYVACHLEYKDTLSGMALIREFSPANINQEQCPGFCYNHRIFPVQRGESIRWLVKSIHELDRLHHTLQRNGIDDSPIRFLTRQEEARMELLEELDLIEQARLRYLAAILLEQEPVTKPSQPMPASAYLPLQHSSQGAHAGAAANHPDERTCAICLEPLFAADSEVAEVGKADDQSSAVVALGCPARHPYHRACVESWGRDNATCPLCRFSFMNYSP